MRYLATSTKDNILNLKTILIRRAYHQFHSHILNYGMKLNSEQFQGVSPVSFTFQPNVCPIGSYRSRSMSIFFHHGTQQWIQPSELSLLRADYSRATRTIPEARGTAMPQDTQSTNAGSMAGHRLRRWPTIEPALAGAIVIRDML